MLVPPVPATVPEARALPGPERAGTGPVMHTRFELRDVPDAAGAATVVVPDEGAYTARFCTADGTTVTFVAGTGAGSHAIVVRDDGTGSTVDEVGDGRVGADAATAAFVALCWEASPAVRHAAPVEETAGERAARFAVITDEPRVLVTTTIVSRYGTCRRCGHRVLTDVYGARRHTNPDDGGFGSRGCRSASWDRLGAWDETLPESWVAAPATGPAGPAGTLLDETWQPPALPIAPAQR